MLSTTEILETLASLFRHAIEASPNLPTPLDQFPQNTSEEASLLLAQWLREHGYESHFYCGRRVNNAKHAWLEVGDIIVDITGDQFSEFPYPVYVGPVTPFHLTFDTPQTEYDLKNGFHDFDMDRVSKLSREYKLILRAL